MKYLKYTGLYFVMFAVGNNILKIAEADKEWTVLFYVGTILWYMGSACGKDS